MALVSSSSPSTIMSGDSHPQLYRSHHHLLVKTAAASTTTTKGNLTLGSGHSKEFRIPSSPSEQYGQVSPSFDASFASSMSITSESWERNQIKDNDKSRSGDVQQQLQQTASSPPVSMDISPAPALRATITGNTKARVPELTTKKDSFPHLARVFQVDRLAVNEKATSSNPKLADLDRPHMIHHASAPAIVNASSSRLAPPQLRPSLFSKSADNLPRFNPDNDAFFERPMNPPPAPSLRNRGTLPLDWNKSSSKAQPVTAALPTTPLLGKQQSGPLVSALTDEPESSPYRMDIDGLSPGGRLSSPVSRRPAQHPRSVSDSSQHNPFLVSLASPPARRCEPGSASSSGSGAADSLGEYFTADLSPIPASRKRVLEEFPGSPTPAAPPTTLLSKPFRRSFEKAMTTTAVPMQVGAIRRQRSSHQLGKRTSSSSLRSTASSLSSAIVPPVPMIPVSVQAMIASSACNKRHAIACAEGKPKTMRRALSVADAVVPGVLARCKLGSSGADSAANRASIATEPSSYVALADGMGPGKSRPQLQQHQSMAPVPESSSPSPSFPWQHDEITGKALPCFKVKDDGLMRITAATLNDVQAGVHSSQLARYLIIDCRFDYEFQGGHIANAINLSQTSEIEQALFAVDDLPTPSTSDVISPAEKTVLIFHCEFSAKRAPTIACFLRNQDRLRNNGVYPNVHYPEVYVLQGGYAEFYKQYPERCIGGYMAMDDPNRLAERSIKLNSFRAGQKHRQFLRANTFTFGQAQHASTMLKIAHDINEDKSTSPRPSSTMNPRPALAPRQPTASEFRAVM